VPLSILKKSALLLVVLALAAMAGASSATAIVPLGQFGDGPGDQAGLLEGPVGTAVDQSGRVYVTETGVANSRVSVFSPSGAFLRAFGKDVVPNNGRTGFEQCTTSCKAGERGVEEGELSAPGGIAVDAEGVVYVAEQGNDRISVFNQQGRFVRTFGKDVDRLNDGTGYEVCTQNCKQGEPGSGPGELGGPAGLAVDRDGLLWVVDAVNNRVSVYTRQGEFLHAFGKGVNRILGGRTDRCSSRCGPGVRSGEAGALGGAVSVGLDAAGNVYVSEAENNRVSVFSPDLAFERAFGADVIASNGEAGFEVCTTATGCKAGTLGGSFGRPGRGGGPINGPGVLNRPSGLVVDASDSVHVSEILNHRVSTFSSALAFLRAFGKDVIPDNAGTGFEECGALCKAGLPGAGTGELSSPVLLALDCRGALYVAEAENGRVQKFGDPGTEPPPCTTPAALSRPFGIMKVRRNLRRGTATLRVSIPWSAALRLRGRGIVPVTRQVEFAGRTRLIVRPTRATRRKLERTGRALVRVKVTYAPWGGRPRTKARTVELRAERATG
jgi:DNA-binding beta-propeller fold protein YncE